MDGPSLARYYTLAKRQAWTIDELPWGELSPIPETSGSAERQARRRALWRSVLTQQLQADQFAVYGAVQFLSDASDPDARLYYTTMVQDETRHTQAWLRLVEDAGGEAERDPNLDRLAHLTLEADTIEEKVWLLQVFYEGLVIPKLKLIAHAAPGTVLGDLCGRLAVDDGIHHGAGMAYERQLLAHASRTTKDAIVRISRAMLPLFVEHMLWRPRERAFVGPAMRRRDLEQIKGYVEDGQRIAASLGIEIDVSDVAIHV